jgi:pilus assembly protein CpaB
MNKTSFIIMCIAVVIAIVVALLMSMKPSPKPVEVIATGTEVLVASRDLAAGDVLKAQDAQWQSFPDNVSYNGLIKKKDQPDVQKLDVYGRPLRRDIQSGEPITTQSLVDAHANYLAAALHPGMRAVSISVRPETTAGGFISPGDYVDIILNFQVSLKGDAANYSDDTVQRFASETILSNVHVMAVDQDAKDESHEAKSSAHTITFEVTKQGAEILSMASTMGQLSLALRRLGEKDTDADENTPLTTDVTTSKVIQRIYKTEASGGNKAAPTIVRMYSGGAVSNVPVRPSSQAETGN